MLAKPTCQVPASFRGRFAKTRKRPNLGTMVFDRVFLPSVLSPTEKSSFRLRSEILTSSLGASLLVAGKPASD